MKKILISFLFIVALVGIVGATSTTFLSPTPTPNEYITKNFVEINVGSTGTNPFFTAIDFNRTLVGWYRLGVMTTVNDSSSYNNNVTCSNCPTVTQGVFGNASMFNGLNQNLSVGNILQLDPSYTQQFTWAGWINVNSTPNVLPRVISKGPVYYLAIQNNNQHAHGGQLVLEVSNDTGAKYDYYANITPGTVDNNFTDPVNQHVWRFFAVTFSTSNNGSSQFIDPNAKWYMDGRKIISIYVTQVSGASFWRGSLPDQFNQSVYLGGVNTRNANISLDNVMIFDRALNESEILSLYNATNAQYRYVFSNLTSGDYFVEAFSGDTDGSISNAGERTFTIGPVRVTSLTIIQTTIGIFLALLGIVLITKTDITRNWQELLIMIILIIVIAGFIIGVNLG